MSAEDEDLREAARAARAHAYAPYSGFPVGAAVRAASGRVYTGVNVENASFPAGTCAERSAVSAAVTAGERALVAVAISVARDEPAPPCGLCRQTLREFGADMDVVLEGGGGRVERLRLADLLPRAFGPDDLPR